MDPRVPHGMICSRSTTGGPQCYSRHHDQIPGWSLGADKVGSPGGVSVKRELCPRWNLAKSFRLDRASHMRPSSTGPGSVDGLDDTNNFKRV